jgi:hypothetical protein
MKLRDHTVISTVTGGAIYFISKSPVLAASTVLAGIFLDLDHFYDYFINVGFRINIKDLFQKCKDYQLRKFYVPLHSYEFIFILAVINCFYPTQAGLGILLGSSIHLIADLTRNYVYFPAYSFIYRWTKKFNVDYLFKSPYGKVKNS